MVDPHDDPVYAAALTPQSFRRCMLNQTIAAMGGCCDAFRCPSSVRNQPNDTASTTTLAVLQLLAVHQTLLQRAVSRATGDVLARYASTVQELTMLVRQHSTHANSTSIIQNLVFFNRLCHTGNGVLQPDAPKNKQVSRDSLQLDVASLLVGKLHSLARETLKCLRLQWAQITKLPIDAKRLIPAVIGSFCEVVGDVMPYAATECDECCSYMASTLCRLLLRPATIPRSAHPNHFDVHTFSHDDRVCVGLIWRILIPLVCKHFTACCFSVLRRPSWHLAREMSAYCNCGRGWPRQ